jgi:hypothetical protein
MKSLNKHLQEFGFKPELSHSIDPTGKKEKLFHKNLYKSLGPYRYDEYCRVQASYDGEQSMMKFIGGDESLFKFLLSSQIDISEQMFQEMLGIIKSSKINPYRILEFGGANGWASDYLINYVFGQVEESVVVDSFPNWSPVNPEIKIHSEDYFDYKTETKFDLIFSILGYSAEDYTFFLEKAISFLSENGVLILGLRISSEQSYQKALAAIFKSECHLNLLGSKSISVGNEEFPILTIKKGKGKFSKNEEFDLIRYCYYNLRLPKRIFGLEAKFFLDLLVNGNVILKERKEWEDGSWLTMSYIEVNEIIFRVVENYKRNLVLEFPIVDQVDIETFVLDIQPPKDYFSASL